MTFSGSIQLAAIGLAIVPRFWSAIPVLLPLLHIFSVMFMNSFNSLLLLQGENKCSQDPAEAVYFKGKIIPSESGWEGTGGTAQSQAWGKQLVFPSPRTAVTACRCLLDQVNLLYIRLAPINLKLVHLLR